jgi:hypothetical protein
MNVKKQNTIIGKNITRYIFWLAFQIAPPSIVDMGIGLQDN